MRLEFDELKLIGGIAHFFARFRDYFDSAQLECEVNVVCVARDRVHSHHAIK